MFKGYRVRYYVPSLDVKCEEYCFRKRKEALWSANAEGTITIYNSCKAGRSNFWKCLKNDFRIINDFTFSEIINVEGAII